MAAGLHPDAELFDVRLVQSERYERVERQMQGLIKRTPRGRVATPAACGPSTAAS
jgi:hypothetical protein